METVTKSKQEIAPKNLLQTCWLNGFSIRAVARKLERSPALVYRAVAAPTAYPKAYERICELLPRRLEDHGK